MAPTLCSHCSIYERGPRGCLDTCGGPRLGALCRPGSRCDLEAFVSEDRQPQPIILPGAEAAPPARHTGPEAHTCEHPGCAKWGSFGFGQGERQRWYCFEHRKDVE